MKHLLLAGIIVLSMDVSASVASLADDAQARDSLKLVAFDGRCSYFMSSPKLQLSPSTTDVHLWQTCWGGSSDLLGNEYGSSIYKVRVDCSSEQYAIAESAAFHNQLWHGGVVPMPAIKEPGLWRPLAQTYAELRDICAPDGLADFDGPESDASL